MRILGVVLLAIGLPFSYLYFRVVAPLSAWPVAFWAATALLGIGLSAILWLPLHFWASKSTTVKSYEKGHERLAHLSMGFLSILLFLGLVRDLLLAGSTLLGESERIGGPEGSVAVFGLSFVLALFGFMIARKGPIVKKIRLTPDTEAPLRIVQISDLHVGTWIGRRYVERLVAQIEALGPIDLLLLTGDIGDGDPHAHIEDLAPLSKIQASVGKFSVTGNHEGYWNETEWNSRIRELGFKILENESETVSTRLGPLSIHGVSDSRSDPVKALATLTPEIYSLFLAHQPKHAPAAIKAGVRLQLSGHTHSGQFLPWSLFIGLAHTYAAGLYRVGKTSIYVNAGTGFWGPPFRLGTRSETTLIEFDPKLS
jgi:uncharacterized protein